MAFKFSNIQQLTRFFIAVISASFFTFPMIDDCKSQNRLHEYQHIKHVSLDKGDSTIVFSVLIHGPELNFDVNKKYYWLQNSNIQVTEGDYAGNLLHGDYLVFGNNNILLTKGEFYSGVKHQLWKQWDVNGNISSIKVYKRGLPHGRWLDYHPKEHIIKQINYKNGQLHGKTIVYLSDGKKVLKYRNGKRVTPIQETKIFTFFRRIFSF